jgi:hypothetical protein
MEPLRKIKNKHGLYYSSMECDIYYNESLHAVETKWKGIYCAGKKLQEILNAIVELLEMKKTSCIIADAREMKVISEPDRDWIINEWYSRAVNAGFCYEALIVTKDTFNEVSIKKIVKEYDTNVVTTKYFLEFDSAARWIKEVCKK